MQSYGKLPNWQKIGRFFCPVVIFYHFSSPRGHRSLLRPLPCPGGDVTTPVQDPQKPLYPAEVGGLLFLA